MQHKTHREPKGKDLVLLDHARLDVGVDEGLQTLCAEVKEDLAVFLLLLLSKSVFRLGDLEFAVALKRHQAYSEVGSAYMESAPSVRKSQ